MKTAITKMIPFVLLLGACAQKAVDTSSSYWERQAAIKEGDEERELFKDLVKARAGAEKETYSLDDRPLVRVSARELGVIRSHEQLREKCSWAGGKFVKEKTDLKGFEESKCLFDEGDFVTFKTLKSGG